jgi:microsomal dipeptidase-like Zn-dependent dipeptidase
MHLRFPLSAALKHMSRARGRRRCRDRWRAWILAVANRRFNYPRPWDPAVTICHLRAGGVGVALSVLYVPFDEFGGDDEAYNAPPSNAYFPQLLSEIRAVEDNIARCHSRDAMIAHNPTELAAALAADKVALIHAVEGGFHLGGEATHVSANVATLARCGVAYITVAHLFWRRVATNVPALPFLPDWLYRLLFPQPASGLSSLGRAAVEAMVHEHILVDLAHMSRQAIADTLAVLDELDPEQHVPVLATHAACRFGDLAYNISDAHIAAIAARKGVVGLIACEHYMARGFAAPQTFSQSMDVIDEHIKRIHHVTGSHDYTALGSDLDGFIKPALPGLETEARFQTVEAELVRRHGPAVAEQICSANALRVLRAEWRGGPGCP